MAKLVTSKSEILEEVEALHDSNEQLDDTDHVLEAMGTPTPRSSLNRPAAAPTKPAARRQLNLSASDAVGFEVLEEVVEEMDETNGIRLFGESQLAELMDMERQESELDQHVAEFYPQQVGASEHDHTISAIADDVRVWDLVSPRAPTVHTDNTRAYVFREPEQLALIEGVAARVYVDEEEAAELARDGLEELVQNVVGKEAEKPILEGDERMVRELLNSHVTASGAVAPDEVLDGLLAEGRRILWNRAERGQDNRPTMKEKPVVQQLQQPQNEKKASVDEGKEREMIREMYGRLTGSGAADAEGILDYLLVEAKRSAGSSTDSEAKPSSSAKWKSKL